MLSACADKAYYLRIDEGGNASVNSSIMNQQLIDGTITGPVTYCSVPAEMATSICPPSP